jgi:hypothetical protein
MREIRIFELDQADVPTRLPIGCPSRVSAMREMRIPVNVTAHSGLS